jgi:thioredoxin 1
MFEQVLNKVTPEYEDKINLYKVDIEKEPEIAGLFRVMSIPNMALISKSGDVFSQQGSLPEDTLKYYFEGLISKK